ncbi:MAG: TonB-dependent siderophore receptor [Akkermansiaceae bacterium]|nr:TonB-dependent siderophore receptor [Akkermansiaceae bacterium]
MKLHPYLTGLSIAASTALLAHSQNADEEAPLLDSTVIKSQGVDRAPLPAIDTATSTGLPLDILETPQSLSILQQEQIEAFGLDTVNDTLHYAPGVQVESVETDRTYYTARGFDITNFQFDGMGVPLVYGNLYGDFDSFMYERVEILRGANGLMTGTGNPSATINFVRKAPTRDFQASLGATYGSWNKGRLQGDFSGPLTEDGRIRGRFVGVLQDQDSYLDRYERSNGLGYGVIEADLGPDTLLTFGHSLEANYADGNLWGALPVAFSDGTPTHYDVSTSTSADWSYWDNETSRTFLRLEHGLNERWKLRAEASYVHLDSDSELFYMYGTPDPSTGLGLFAYPSAFTQETHQWIYDLQVNGTFDWLGREHDLVGGFNYSVSDTVAGSAFGPIGGAISVPLEDWTGDFPRPDFGAPTSGADWLDKEYGIYGATRLKLTDSLQTVLGARIATFEGRGETYGSSKTTEYDHEVIPYLGVVHEITDDLNAYASYTDIFQPQTEIDIAGNRLDAISGQSFETGLKYSLMDGRAYASAALFQIEQNNVAELAGTSGGMNYYTQSEGITSRGFEAELAGQVTDQLRVSASYTLLDLENADGTRANTYIPKHSLKLLAIYEVPGTELDLGAAARWQSRTYGKNVEQNSFAIFDLMASYPLSENLSASVNLRNVTDEKYWSSLYWAGSFGQGFYGAPRSVDFSLDYEF